MYVVFRVKWKNAARNEQRRVGCWFDDGADVIFGDVLSRNKWTNAFEKSQTFPFPSSGLIPTTHHITLIVIS